jgi:hypothetical protein
VNGTLAVVATGNIFGDAAGQAATVVKLTRTILPVPLALFAGMAFSPRQGKQSPQAVNVWKLVPARCSRGTRSRATGSFYAACDVIIQARCRTLDGALAPGYYIDGCSYNRCTSMYSAVSLQRSSLAR